jgi:hypothetical protein
MMTIIIVSWVALSVLFLFALLGAAARPTPRRDEEFVAAKEKAMPSSKPFSKPAGLATSSQTA